MGEAFWAALVVLSTPGILESFELATMIKIIFFALVVENFLLSGVISGALLYIRDEFPAVRDNYFLQVQCSLLITACYNMVLPPYIY